MVHAHQTDLHNRITRAGYGVRVALRDEAVMNKALGEPAGHRSESTVRRIKSACEPLVQGLLFSGEAEFPRRCGAPATSPPPSPPPARAIPKGRSLRDLDLSRRLFKYPCSYLIYTESFDALPGPAREYVYRRLWEVLDGSDQGKEFAHLSPQDRRAVLAILRDTKKGLPRVLERETLKARARDAAGAPCA